MKFCGPIIEKKYNKSFDHFTPTGYFPGFVKSSKYDMNKRTLFYAAKWI